MTSLRKQLRELDPEVVGAARVMIETGRQHYSCAALARAEGLSWWGQSEYASVYTQWVKRVGWGSLPTWWSASEYADQSGRNQFYRLQALEDFEQAIIEAKKPSLLSRLGDWLMSPCDYHLYS